jgi:hypothetical protein
MQTRAVGEMAGSVNKDDQIIEDYAKGYSIPQLSHKYGKSKSSVRFLVKRSGIMRGRTEAIKLAATQGRLFSAFKWKNREFSEDHKKKILEGRRKWADDNSVGVSKKSDGYVVHTRGSDLHRGVHVTIMEERIGRRLLPDECVHHIDGNRSNNEISNLALMTKSAHGKLHRREDKISGVQRERDEYGRFR